MTAGQDNPPTLRELLTVLADYSLIKWEERSGFYSVHRLVQAVLRESREEPECKAIQQAIREAVAKAAPNDPTLYWSQLDRLLPHQRVCVGYIESMREETQVSALF